MVSIIDYGVGNLFSLSSSLNALGIENRITNKKEDLERADRIILPGVGAFADAADKLRATRLVPVLDEQVKKGKPLLGICLGMQLLFEKSYEYGEHEGLSYIKGDVVSLSDEKEVKRLSLKVPHMGWNELHILKKDNPLMKYSKDGDFVYYVHSFYVRTNAEALVAMSGYGVNVAGAVANGNVFGTQFHPEKSGEVGLRILKAFSEITV